MIWEKLTHEFCCTNQGQAIRQGRTLPKNGKTLHGKERLHKRTRKRGCSENCRAADCQEMVQDMTEHDDKTNATKYEQLMDLIHDEDVSITAITMKGRRKLRELLEP